MIDDNTYRFIVIIVISSSNISNKGFWLIAENLRNVHSRLDLSSVDLLLRLGNSNDSGCV